MVHFHPLKVVHFRPLRYAQFNPLEVVYYARFLHTKLKVFDLQDGSEGIYVENNFRAEATNEVLSDIIDDINIPTVPQVSGITKVLKRRNRKIKVTVLNNYKLILKPKL